MIWFLNNDILIDICRNFLFFERKIQSCGVHSMDHGLCYKKQKFIWELITDLIGIVMGIRDVRTRNKKFLNTQNENKTRTKKYIYTCSFIPDRHNFWLVDWDVVQLPIARKNIKKLKNHVWLQNRPGIWARMGLGNTTGWMGIRQQKG